MGLRLKPLFGDSTVVFVFEHFFFLLLQEKSYTSVDIAPDTNPDRRHRNAAPQTDTVGAKNE
jgi:hypothetical protein